MDGLLLPRIRLFRWHRPPGYIEYAVPPLLALPGLRRMPRPESSYEQELHQTELR